MKLASFNCDEDYGQGSLVGVGRKHNRNLW